MANLNNRPASYQKLSYTQKISKINRKLRSGDVTLVANATDYSTSHVSDVLAGKYNNQRIVNRAYDMTRNRVENLELL